MSDAYAQSCSRIIADTETRLGRPFTEQERDAVVSGAQGSLMWLEVVGRDLAAATTPEQIEAALTELVAWAESWEPPRQA